MDLVAYSEDVGRNSDGDGACIAYLNELVKVACLKRIGCSGLLVKCK